MPELIPVSITRSATRSISTSLLVHRRVTPKHSRSLVPIYTPGWREAL